MKRILNPRMLMLLFLLMSTVLVQAQKKKAVLQKKIGRHEKVKPGNPLDSITKVVKGNLLVPFEGYDISMPYGLCKLQSHACLLNPGITFRSAENKKVRAAWDGIVSTIRKIDDMYVVIVRCGQLFFAYSNLAKPQVELKQHVNKGQSIGKLVKDDNGYYSTDFLLSGQKEINPTKWFSLR